MVINKTILILIGLLFIGFIICMDCRAVYEVVWEKASIIDWWIWKRQYKNKKKLKQKVGELTK